MDQSLHSLKYLGLSGDRTRNRGAMGQAFQQLVRVRIPATLRIEGLATALPQSKSGGNDMIVRL